MTVAVPELVTDLEAGSPLWWVRRLNDELDNRQEDMQLFRDLVDDKHETVETAEKSKKFRLMAGMSTTNLTGLVVEATAERMEVEGFRFGDDPDDDKDAWAIWQRSDFDAGSAEAITQALTYGRDFISVDPNGGDPRLIQEDARQVVVAHSSDGLRTRIAAWKCFTDEWTGGKWGTLYTPLRIFRFKAVGSKDRPTWVPRGISSEPDEFLNPLREVPFFELRNRPLGRTKSEIANCVIPQQALNQAVFNTFAVAEYGAFRQKWVTGIELQRDSAGNPVSPFDASVSKLFVGEPPQDATGVPVQFGNFDATDLSGYLDLGREIALHIARISRLPVTYFMKPENLAAETVALMVSALIKKCQRRVKGYEPAFEDAMRCAFKVIGDPRAEEMTAETRWASMETRTVAQDADAAVKLTQGDNPVITPQTAQERYLGMSQTERDRDQAWRLENGAAVNFDALLSNEPEPANPAAP